MALHVGQPPGNTRSKRLWIAYWIGLFAVTHLPVRGTGPVRIEHADKVVHFAAYFLLTWLGGRQLLAAGRSGALPLLLIWAVVYLIYAALDECLQSLVGRTMSLADWLADLAGVVAATALLILRPPRNRVSDQRGNGGGNRA